MGDIKKARKQYTVPRKRWDKARIEAEKKIVETYGLKNKKELRKSETMVRNKRTNAKRLLALSADARKKAEKELFESIARIGLLPRESSIDDVLSLQTQELLEKRLQTVVWRKNLAKTVKQARQFIVHGHIAVNGKKLTAPSYIVKAAEMEKISYFKRPMELEPPKAETKTSMQKEFEAVKGAEEGEPVDDTVTEEALDE